MTVCGWPYILTSLLSFHFLRSPFWGRVCELYSSFYFSGVFPKIQVFAKDNKLTRQRSQLGVPVCGTHIVFLFSVLEKDNKLVQQRSQFSVPICGTFTVFLLANILQTYSVFAKDKRPKQQILATTATTGDQSKADSADKPRADSGDQK